MAPPPISPIDTNWYQDATWTSTVTPALTAAQTNYTAAQTAVNAYYPVYNAAKTALETAISGPPITTLTALNTFTALRDDFNTKQAQYNLLLQTLKTRSDALISAFTQAQSYVDTKGDVLLDSYIAQLTSEVGLQLTRTGVDTNTLPTLLSNTNSTRNVARSDFISALITYQDSENTLCSERVELQALQDQKLLAQAEVVYRQALVTLATAALAQAQSDLNAAQAYLDSLLPTDPGYSAALAARDAALVVRNQAQSDLNNAQANLTAANAAYATASTNVTNQQVVVTTSQTQRDGAKSTLNTKLATYTSKIDDLLDAIKSAYDVHSGIPQQFADALATEASNAQSIVDQALAVAVQNDQNLHNALLSTYPTTPPGSVTQSITDANAQTVERTAKVIKSFDGSQVSVALANINVPELPPPGTMSINDLMRFIAAIQLVISNLASAIRQSDNAVDSLRARVWDLQGTFEVQKNQTLYGWALDIIQADENYNVQVANENALTSSQIVTELNNILNNPSTVQAINSTITQLNSDIDDQNARAADTATALNNSYFIAVDTVNQNQSIQPNTTNTADILNQDPNTPIPSPRFDSPPFTTPDTIPYYPTFNPFDYPPIPSTFPVPLPQPDDTAVQPDPTSPTVYVPPDPSVLPTASDVDTLNQTVEAINTFLYPIRERLAAQGFDFNLINKFLLREYTTVRDITDVIDIDAVTEAFSVYSNLIKQSQKLQSYPGLSDKGKVIDPLIKFNDAARVAVTEGQHATSEPVGAGAGILNSNILASSSKVSSAVQTVLGSTVFTNAIASLIESGSLIGGLQTLTQFPTSIPNYSQMGIVRSELVGEVGQTADARVAATGKLSESDKALATNTANALIATATDPAALRDRVVNLVSQAGTKGLNEDEIQKLIAALLYILQLLLLLVAALLVGAVSGETDLNAVLAKVFEKPKDLPAKQTIQTLKDLGVKNVENLTPSAPDFVSDFANALTPLFSSSQQDTFVSQVTTSFSNHGVSVTISTNPTETGPSIANALNGAPIDVRGVIRDEIIKSEIENAELIKTDVAKREIARLSSLLFHPTIKPSAPAESISAPITTTTATVATTSTGIVAAPVTASGTPSVTQPTSKEAFTPPITKVPLSPETQANTTSALNNNAPTTQGLSNQDRNTIVLGVASGLITASHGQALATALTKEPGQTSDSVFAFLQAEREAKPTEDGTVKPLSTPLTPKSAGIPGNVAAPQALPKDTYAQLRDAFQNLALQTDNKAFTEEAATQFAKNIEPLTSFYQKSLSLILDPGATFVRNFSIFTMDGSLASKQTPLVIPIGV